MDLAKIGAFTKKWTIRITLGIAITGALGSALYTYVTLHFVYSTGERVGFVQKISKKGWLCKTSEGELAVVNIAGQPAQIFEFTVPDDSIVKQIEERAGHRVVLTYDQHVGIPSRCFGESPYFIVGVHDAK